MLIAPQQLNVKMSATTKMPKTLDCTVGLDLDQPTRSPRAGRAATHHDKTTKGMFNFQPGLGQPTLNPHFCFYS